MIVELTNEDKKLLRCNLLYIMDEIHRICVSNNIKYSLFYGSLLGAVMYKGFIPWDDDIDIVFTKDQYVLFEKACKKQLSDDFEFQSTGTDSNYKVPGITKIRLKNTILLEDVDKKQKINHGVWVDITVLQNIDDRLSNLKKTKYYFSLFRDKYYYFSSIKDLSFKGFIYKSLRKITPPFSLKRTGFLFEKWSTQCKDNSTRFVFQPFSYENDVYLREWTKEYLLYPFEGREYYGFKEYDLILKERYPNYNIIPPLSERVSNHHFIKIKLLSKK